MKYARIKIAFPVAIAQGFYGFRQFLDDFRSKASHVFERKSQLRLCEREIQSRAAFAYSNQLKGALVADQVCRRAGVNSFSSLNRLRLACNSALNFLTYSDKVRDSDPSAPNSRTNRL